MDIIFSSADRKAVFTDEISNWEQVQYPAWTPPYKEICLQSSNLFSLLERITLTGNKYGKGDITISIQLKNNAALMKYFETQGFVPLSEYRFEINTQSQLQTAFQLIVNNSYLPPHQIEIWQSIIERGKIRPVAAESKL